MKLSKSSSIFAIFNAHRDVRKEEMITFCKETLGMNETFVEKQYDMWDHTGKVPFRSQRVTEIENKEAVELAKHILSRHKNPNSEGAQRHVKQTLYYEGCAHNTINSCVIEATKALNNR